MTNIQGVSITALKTSIAQLSIDAASVAIEQLLRDGITSDSELPFVRPTYNLASRDLCEKLRSLGLPFLPDVIGTYLETEGGVYAIYNPDLFSFREAIDWLGTKFQGT